MQHEKIVITGGMGFIFSHVTEYFLQKGAEVHVLDNLSAGSHKELIPAFSAMPGKFFFYEEDVSFLPAQSLIKRIDPTYIIHAAAISDVDQSIKNPAKVIHANNTASLNVFEAARACKKLKKLLYVSTDEVYGECDHPKTEDEIIFPKNPYALSKAFGSIMRLAYDNTYPELKDKTCETRFCNVFGPRQDARKIIPAIKEALATDKPLKVHNGGGGFRQFISVKEIPPLIEILLENGMRTYNITSDEGCTVLDLIGHTEEITGKKIKVISGRRSGMDMRYQMSSKRLKDEFSWSPSSKFVDSLADYLLS